MVTLNTSVIIAILSTTSKNTTVGASASLNLATIHTTTNGSGSSGSSSSKW